MQNNRQFFLGCGTFLIAYILLILLLGVSISWSVALLLNGLCLIGSLAAIGLVAAINA